MKSSIKKGRWSTIATNVTELEKQQIVDRAQRNGMTLSKYIRARLLEDDIDRENIEKLNTYQKKLYRVANKILALSQFMAENNLGSEQTQDLLSEVSKQLDDKGYKNE